MKSREGSIGSLAKKTPSAGGNTKGADPCTAKKGANSLTHSGGPVGRKEKKCLYRTTEKATWKFRGRTAMYPVLERETDSAM